MIITQITNAIIKTINCLIHVYAAKNPYGLNQKQKQKKNYKNHTKLLITSTNINYTYNNRHKVKL